MKYFRHALLIIIVLFFSQFIYTNERVVTLKKSDGSLHKIDFNVVETKLSRVLVDSPFIEILSYEEDKFALKMAQVKAYLAGNNGPLAIYSVNYLLNAVNFDCVFEFYEDSFAKIKSCIKTNQRGYQEKISQVNLDFMFKAGVAGLIYKDLLF